MVQNSTKITAQCHSKWLLTVGLLLWLGAAGCQPVVPPPETDPEPVPAAEPEPVEPAPEPEPAPVEPPPPPEPMRIALLSSSDNPEYEAVKRAIIELNGRRNVDLFDLGGSALRARVAIDSLRSRGHDKVVAIGLLAAQATQRLDAEKVVFCQVLNHVEHELAGKNRSGVLALPPLDGAAELWHSIARDVTRVGVISGGGHDAVIASASKAFAARGIELVHQVANSDKEMLLAFQRMLPEIQGYWLLPDNRILSRDTIRDLVSYARRSGVGVLVNGQRFLELGATVSAATNPEDIAARAHAMLLDFHESGEFRNAHMVFPRKSVLHLNEPVAVELGYDPSAAPKSLLAR